MGVQSHRGREGFRPQRSKFARSGSHGNSTPPGLQHDERAPRAVSVRYLSESSSARTGRAHRDSFRGRLLFSLGRRTAAHPHRLAAEPPLRTTSELVPSALQSVAGTVSLSCSEAVGLYLSG